MTRPGVVARVVDVLALHLDHDEQARAEWERRLDWATSDELDEGMRLALDPIKDVIREYRAAQQAELEADDWRAFAAAHGTEWDS